MTIHPTTQPGAGRPTRGAARGLAAGLTAALLAAGCGYQRADDQVVDDPPASNPQSDAEPGDPAAITVLAHDSFNLDEELLADFTAATGIEVEVRYGGTAELAATILEEGENSPADVYWAQDAGALGALAGEGRLTTLPDGVLNLVDPRFRSNTGEWIGITGRVRTIVWNTDVLTEDELPTSVFDLTDPAYDGKIGWAPANGSFQAFVTAMRVVHGEDTTREWLEGMLANGVTEFPNNSSIVEAVGRGEVELGLVNHYYLLRFKAEDPGFPAENLFLKDDVAGLVNTAGAGILTTTDQPSAAEQLITWMLGDEAQAYFGTFTDELEYPLALGQEASPELPSLASLNPPDVDLSDLADLEGTLVLLREVGALI